MLMQPDEPGPPVSKGRGKWGTDLGAGVTGPAGASAAGPKWCPGPFSIFLFVLSPFSFLFSFCIKAFEFYLNSNQNQRFSEMFSIHLGPRE
jgi:hypothetical protein